ncbi:Vps52-domain-containing protein [Punctularia strigosozonata HHB-11173 SS5]|uniref:Vps52-domain-containing protein n=1 Tax=Punctularia strigosozonata (strain HHB-11173) TaxID=741275 RepID=UPI0004417180|nr:Vps52-domain-containing protein [Punctularia strigosozonata HHB-11173 SS5]EIN10314.1 Vps52-domain-containing protein [Punctularia strigosozonata HHB-11173 SS5]
MDPPHVLTGRAKEFVELHDQVQTSVNLLDSLESFLSTFQKDLSAVSGQISDLQSRSKDIDNRLKSRRKIEKPLSNLLSNITIPPSLATTILDTEVKEPWIGAIVEFEQRLEMVKARARVKAARDLSDVTEGLRIVAATKIRAFFLTLFQPIRSSVTTNMQVLQTSVFLKYQPLFAFLQRQAPNVAQEIQRAYVGAARTFYETGFRRYARSLGYIKTRNTETFQTITASAGEKGSDWELNDARLALSRIDGPGVTLAYMADDKSHTEPVEALLRSLFLVLMDNATAEYTFICSFFAPPSPQLPASASAQLSPLPSFGSLLTPTGLTGLRSPGGSELDPADAADEMDGPTPKARRRADSVFSAGAGAPLVPRPDAPREKEEKVALETIWKQVMDPVMEYCQSFSKTILDPPPATIPLLTLIRLTEDVMAEVQKRQPQCGPLESFIFTQRLQMWPIFQKGMSEHVDALKRLHEGTGAGLALFSRATPLTDAVVFTVCKRYVVMFGSFLSLTAQDDETMIFSNLLRLRQELAKLILKHTEKVTDPARRATAQSSIYESVLQGLTRELQTSSHPKAQSEIAYWRECEEQARRRIISSSQTRR